MQPILVNKAYKFRIYPNKKQEILIAKTIGCSPFVFNHFLSLWNDTYKEAGKGLTYPSCSAELTQLKKRQDTLWLKELDSTALQSSLKNLTNAFSHFFKKQNGMANKLLWYLKHLLLVNYAPIVNTKTKVLKI